MTDTEKATLERRIDELCAEVERLKEREQNLVTLLRNDWDMEASWDGLRRFWYVGLTDEGVRKRDEREAALGRGECKVDVLNTGDCAGYECSEYIMHCNACGHEFGHVLYNEDGDVWMSERPNFCPNCGREVTRDEQ